MQVILNKKEYNDIWDRIYSEYRFDQSREDWLILPLLNKKYHISDIWTEEQEKTVNDIFKKVCSTKMYALDWQHDCFIFAPDEDIPLYHWYYDKDRDCNVYFPSYYPDGDYHFFISLDWSFGLFGHPWKNEIYVMGNELIKEFEKLKAQLNIAERVW